MKLLGKSAPEGGVPAADGESKDGEIEAEVLVLVAR